MRSLALVLAALVILLTAAPFVPQAAAYQPYPAVAAVALAALLFVLLLAAPRERRPEPARVQAATPPVALAPASRAEAEVAAFLALLQEKGRLVDFLMDDITPYSDAQVGAAARVVHEGCKAALKECFSVHPVRKENEGERITVPAGYAADEYRLVGKIAGEAPFSGTLKHRGWRTEGVKLPRVVGQGDRLPTLAPAEVEIK
jgi:hypothetical protein